METKYNQATTDQCVNEIMLHHALKRATANRSSKNYGKGNKLQSNNDLSMR